MTLDLIRPQWPAPEWVRAVASTRRGGCSLGAFASLNLAVHCGDDEARVQANRRAWAAASGMPAPPVWLSQVHGRDVAVEPGADSQPTADAAVTVRRGQPLAVMTADCVPILLACRRQPWVAVAHAGWRGLACGVIASAVSHAPADADLIAWIGPCIRAAHYEVDATVRDGLLAAMPTAASEFVESRPGHWWADLAGVAGRQLEALDIAGFDSRLSVFDDPGRFYSYRRDAGQTGRLACAIWIE